MIEQKQDATGESEFGAWRRSHPATSFKDFYAALADAIVAEDLPHSTLGANLVGLSYEKSGVDAFNMLLQYGLTPLDVCVDYGCGTLRVGRHVINRLGPRAYWGLDISEALLRKGESLLGSDLAAEKSPNLRMISGQAIAEATAMRPSFVFSIKVMQHVHPCEIPEYFQNILTLIGRHGHAIVASHWNNGPTHQYSDIGWDHGEADLEAVIRAAGGAMVLLGTEDVVDNSVRTGRRKGEFLVVHRDAAADPDFKDCLRKLQERRRMKIIVTAERAQKVLGRCEFEVEDEADQRKSARRARRAFEKFVKENPDVSLFDADVRIRFDEVID